MTVRPARKGRARWWWVPAALIGAAHAGAAEMRLRVIDAEGHPIPDVVVLVQADSPPAPSASVVRDVKVTDMSVLPRVTVVQPGDRVRFVNLDRMRHHVYSFSLAQKLNLSLQPGGTSSPVVFGWPGVVTIGCNIHDGMAGYVYVADTPWYGKSDADGRVQLSGLPKGMVRVRIWHARMAEPEVHTVRQITLINEAPSSVVWRLLLASPVEGPRVPHAPGYLR